jgi:hypothetical protein
MGMGIVSDRDFHKEISNSSTNPTKSTDKIDKTSDSPDKAISGEIVDVNRGRGVGNPNVPDSLRKLIGDTSLTDGRSEALQLAASFGISGSSTSAYAVGATSTGSYDDRPNEKLITKSKQRISKRARGKLLSALRHITEDKLEGAKARDLAGIAKDMSTVVKQMEDTDKAEDKSKNGPTFVFYSPQIRKEEEYEVVHAKE